MPFKRFPLWLFILPLLICFDTANAQGTHEFLGSPRQVPDKVSPKHGIRYNTQGYDEPKVKWDKKISKWQKKGVPDSAIQEILAFPGSPNAIGRWIDDAFDQVRAQFVECGGSLAQRARGVSPRGVTVTIMPSAFYEPYYKVNVAGVFYPKTREIKVLNIYYTWSGSNKGWMRHARDLLVWEMGNYIGVASGVLPEPRPAGWPCNAPPLKK